MNENDLSARKSRVEEVNLIHYISWNLHQKIPEHLGLLGFHLLFGKQPIALYDKWHLITDR